MFPNGERPKRRVAAVLMLVRLIEGEPHMLFIRRSQKVSRHKGQISFPGGSFDATDDNLEFTALREAQEEMGIDPALLRILGSLPPIDTIASNFLVHPFIAVPKEPAATLVYQPDNFEVEHIIEIPLATLLNPASKRIEQWVMRGATRPAPFYNYKNHVIWGATAFILDNFTAQVSAGQWQELFELQ